MRSKQAISDEVMKIYFGSLAREMRELVSVIDGVVQEATTEVYLGPDDHENLVIMVDRLRWLTDEAWMIGFAWVRSNCRVPRLRPIRGLKAVAERAARFVEKSDSAGLLRFISEEPARGTDSDANFDASPDGQAGHEK